MGIVTSELNDHSFTDRKTLKRWKFFVNCSSFNSILFSLVDTSRFSTLLALCSNDIILCLILFLSTNNFFCIFQFLLYFSLNLGQKLVFWRKVFTFWTWMIKFNKHIAKPFTVWFLRWFLSLIFWALDRLMRLFITQSTACKAGSCYVAFSVTRRAKFFLFTIFINVSWFEIILACFSFNSFYFHDQIFDILCKNVPDLYCSLLCFEAYLKYALLIYGYFLNKHWFQLCICIKYQLY